MLIRERGGVTAKLVSNQAAKIPSLPVGEVAELNKAGAAENAAAESHTLLKRAQGK